MLYRCALERKTGRDEQSLVKDGREGDGLGAGCCEVKERLERGLREI